MPSISSRSSLQAVQSSIVLPSSEILEDLQKQVAHFYLHRFVFIILLIFVAERKAKVGCRIGKSKLNFINASFLSYSTCI